MSSINRVFTVQSFTDPTIGYTLSKNPEGEWECSCPCFQYRNHCKHVDKICAHLNLRPKVAVSP